MKKQLCKLCKIGLAAFALLTLSLLPARANLTWNFSISGTGGYYGSILASGTLTTSDTAVPLTGGGWGGDVTSLTGYQILGITGTFNGSPITGIEANPNFPGNILNYTIGSIYDNALIPGSAPLLDYYGLVFTVGSSWDAVFSNNSPDGGGYAATEGADWHTEPVSLTITPVPEPTTMVAGAMLLLPFGFSTLRMFRKTRTA